MANPEEVAALQEAQRARLIPETDRALRTASEDIRVWPPDWRSTGSVDYFYRHQSLLVRDEGLNDVTSALSGLGASVDSDAGTGGTADSGGTSADSVGEPLLPGLRRLSARHREDLETGELVSDLEARLGHGMVSHEHAFTVSYGVGCPATEPDMVGPAGATPSTDELQRLLWPPIGDATSGRDVRVAVVDTGLLKNVDTWAPWLDNIAVNNADIDRPDLFTVVDGVVQPGSDGFADPYAGHGSFVAGVLRAVAPACEISVQKYIDTDGFILESSMVQQVCEGLVDDADVICMSAGGYTRNNIPPMSFDLLWQSRLSKIGGVVFVAAAGNDATRSPFWPAAFPWCVGVGSMTRDGQDRSWFSNLGSWVDVFAPGEDIVNAYPKMRYRVLADGSERDLRSGIAKWSGTSFSTPIVVGLIAARMSSTGETGRQAADALMAIARGQYKPGVGPRLFP